MSNNRYQTLKVKEVVKETADTITIHFKQPLFRKVAYFAGQFLTLIVEDDKGKKHRRAYSLCSAPHLDSTLNVSVKRVEGGLVSNLLNDKAKAGDKIEVMEPIGNFVLRTHPDNERHIILFGGGSGITPLMSMIKVTLNYEPNSKVSLIYANSHEDCIIFKDQLDKLQTQYQDRFELIHVLSKPKAPQEGFTGRLTSDFINNTLENLPQMNETEYFICGPEGMMKTVEDTLSERGVSEDSIHKESFFASVDEESAEVEGDNNAETVSIIIEGEEHRVFVPANKTILEAALDEEIDIPYSCQSGLCTACRGLCLNGKVKMDLNEALSDAEITEGYVLTCQSHPLTNDVKIDMDA